MLLWCRGPEAPNEAELQRAEEVLTYLHTDSKQCTLMLSNAGKNIPRGDYCLRFKRMFWAAVAVTDSLPMLEQLKKHLRCVWEASRATQFYCHLACFF